jgi:hypothetical protein
MRNDLVEIDAILIDKTENALLVDVGDDENVWLPSQTCTHDRDTQTVTLPEWLAIERGLV